MNASPATHRIEIHYCAQCRWLLRDRIDPARDPGHVDRTGANKEGP